MCVKFALSVVTLQAETVERRNRMLKYICQDSVPQVALIREVSSENGVLHDDVSKAFGIYINLFNPTHINNRFLIYYTISKVVV